MSVYDQFGIRRVINGRSYSTKVGGCLMAPEVLQAMQEAAQSFVRIEDLQEHPVSAGLSNPKRRYPTSDTAHAPRCGQRTTLVTSKEDGRP